ncbi:hypothetical protein [Citrobacter portucalensis]|uniref:hypothetical protein n=1 Tax=Citrobacter portucalensis TaxID=1639133 RepID=UPI00388FECC4
MAHDVPLGCAPDEYDDLISGTCSHLPFRVGYATYTIKTNGHGSWNDSDAGNAGKIVRE